tara:strand:+ start:1896 stop:2024 length:129 start_codon:yes stop_codon:yes gene_type:complete
LDNSIKEYNMPKVGKKLYKSVKKAKKAAKKTGKKMVRTKKRY